jgi:DNA gyrase subunit A
VQLVKGVADLVNDKKIEGISDVNDYSDRTGIRIAYEVKREAMGTVVLNQLFKYSSLQTSFSYQQHLRWSGGARCCSG